MKIVTVSPYETSAADFFKEIQEAKAEIVVDVRLHASNQLCGYSKEGDLAYFVPAILKIPYVHDTRFAPKEELLKSYISGGCGFERYREGYAQEIQAKEGISTFLKAYGSYQSIAIIGTATKKRHSHAEVLKGLLEEK